jgi:hypothetical protein
MEHTNDRGVPYGLAQVAMAQLKEAVYLVLLRGPEGGMTNAAIGRSLGIYGGHVGHEGHISRTLLALLESEGVVEQDKQNKRWQVRRYAADGE